MHGRPRRPLGQSVGNAKDASKAGKLRLLLAEVLRNHQERCYTHEALKQNAQLLELNPEVYTAWNYRKLAIQHFMDLAPDEAARKLLAEDELRVVERALQVNIKSYGAWHHRKWIMQFGFASMGHEFWLLRRLLKDDSRNFHGWGYRRFAVKLSNIPVDKELDFATEKINENFSNYSAWHYRSTLLSQLIKEEMNKEKILEDEYALVNQAYFTEPDDQSAWFYNTWLLGETKCSCGPCLVGTFPSNGSTIYADVDTESTSVCLSSRNPLSTDYKFYANGVPIILCFSEVVTDVVVKVSCEPELGCMKDICWRPLSSIQGPSRTWVAEFPLQGCRQTECAISLGISSSGSAGQEMDVKFQVQITVDDWSGKHIDSGAKRQTRKGGFLWPSQMSCDKVNKERRHELEQEEIVCSAFEQGLVETDPGGILLSQGCRRRTVTTEVGKVHWQQKILEEQIENLRELLELEKNSKWAKLTLSRVLLVLGEHTHNFSQYADEVLKLLRELTGLDPDHVEYYQSLLSSTFITKVVQNPKFMKQLWWESPHTADGNKPMESGGWLRWNGLSLSKFDSLEKFLWVQRLDLSHNQLGSIDGLEALQLLVALDVSHNRLSHVTSLVALRQIAGLQFLNISHNEIGNHSVDSTRYSFSSVLTNQVKRPSLEIELQKDAILEDKWEILAVFGGMNLRAIEITGNLAANNQVFREALVKALPFLELLDGEEVH